MNSRSKYARHTWYLIYKLVEIGDEDVAGTPKIMVMSPEIPNCGSIVYFHRSLSRRLISLRLLCTYQLLSQEEGGGGWRCTFVAECRSAELCSLLRIHIIYFSKQCLLRLEKSHLLSLSTAEAALVSAYCFGPQRSQFMPEDQNARTQWWIVTRGPFLESAKTLRAQLL